MHCRQAAPPAVLLRDSNLSTPQLACWLRRQRDRLYPQRQQYLYPLPEQLDAAAFSQAFAMVIKANPLLCQRLVIMRGIPRWQQGAVPELPVIKLDGNDARAWTAGAEPSDEGVPRFALLHSADGIWRWWMDLPAVMLNKAGARGLIRRILACYGRESALAPERELEDQQAQRRAYLESPRYAEDLAFWRDFQTAPMSRWYARHRHPAAVAVHHRRLELSAAGLFDKDCLPAALTAALTVYLHCICQEQTVALGLTVVEPSRDIGHRQSIIPLNLEWRDEENLAELQQRIQAQIHQTAPRARRLPPVSSPVAPFYNVLLEIEDPDDLAPVNPAEFSTDVMVLRCRYDAGARLVTCDFQLNQDLFPEDLVPFALEQFAQAVACLGNPEQHLGKITLLGARDKQLLEVWNDTTIDYPADRTLADLFEEQVEKTPENIAVVFPSAGSGRAEDERLTYCELNEKADQLAHALIEHGVQADTLVGICAERSLEMIIGLLGILKAGGAYVPLDPDYPEERLRFMLEDCGAEILLTQTRLHERLPGFAGTLLDLDDRQLYAERSAENPRKCCGPEHLAYLIYTSGSTGRLKGVMVEHRGALNLASFQKRTYNISTQSHILQFSSLSFDAATWEVLMAITGGGSLYLFSSDRIKAEIQSLLKEHAVTHATLPPSVAHTLDEKQLETVQYLTVAGEACPSDLAARFSQDRVFINAYGPTETTVCASMTDMLSEHETPHIGHPIANTRIYILDGNLQPLPPGIPGELCIAGAGLARGYLNRPNLTAEKFVEVEIFGKTERIYRTGDLARWRADGNLEYLGRLDHQIKLRGFRN
ncbi:MAG: amino acid adenylation domain-containing protein [Candidatus Electrothrix scaldis]|nr:MAG: amino acid adenylation domain-containing protein [Candidatus Electrothrix sp. GW3-3]